MIRTMALREIRNRYVGSFIGMVWSVLHPMVMVFIYWFVFSVGFKMQPTGDHPFVIWFFCAYVPFTTFSEMISITSESAIIHKTLIKRTLFPSEILPFIYVVSSGITHLIMLGILVLMLVISGIGFSLYSLQFLIYYLGLIVFMTGLGWLFSALNVFVRDVGQMVKVIMQIWFWATPIFWQLQMLPERYHPLLKLNPLYYIVQGYRDTFLYKVPFWHNLDLTLYFWALALITFAVGGLVFRRLKPEFADVL